MNDIWDWFVNLPRYFAEFGNWLNQPIGWGDFSFTPLQALGVSAGAFFGVLIALKIKNLIL